MRPTGSNITSRKGSRRIEAMRRTSDRKGEHHDLYYTMKPLPFDPQKVKGLSEKILVSHYENNYGAPSSG
jgi:hypothetical protein